MENDENNIQASEKKFQRNSSRGFERLIRLNFARGSKFALIGFTSFLVVEGALALFTSLKMEVILATPLAYEVSIFYGFVLNDRITVSNRGPFTRLVRIIRYNMVYIGGIAIATLIVVILASFGVKPLMGNVAGALFAFPVNYAVSMIVVWKQKIS